MIRHLLPAAWLAVVVLGAIGLHHRAGEIAAHYRDHALQQEALATNLEAAP